MSAIDMGVNEVQSPDGVRAHPTPAARIAVTQAGNAKFSGIAIRVSLHPDESATSSGARSGRRKIDEAELEERFYGQRAAKAGRQAFGSPSTR
jgi:hypothetical protein